MFSVSVWAAAAQKQPGFAGQSLGEGQVQPVKTAKPAGAGDAGTGPLWGHPGPGGRRGRTPQEPQHPRGMAGTPGGLQQPPPSAWTTTGG